MQVQSVLNIEIETKYKKESEIIKTGLKYFTSLCNRVYNHSEMEGSLYRGGLALDKGEITADRLTELKTEVERNLALYRFGELHDLMRDHSGSFRATTRGDKDSMITFMNRNPEWGKDRTFNLYTGRVYVNNLISYDENITYYDALTQEDFARIKYGEKYFNEAQFIKMCLFPEYKNIHDDDMGIQETPSSMMDVWNFDMFIEIDDIFMIFMRTFLKNGGTEHDLSTLICNTLVDRVIYLLTNIGPKLDLILKPNVRYVGLEILNARKTRNLEIDIFDRGEMSSEVLKSEWSLLSFMKDMIICHLLNKNINSISTDLSVTEANKVISNLNAVFMTTMDYNIDVVASFIPGMIMAMSDNARGLIPKCLAELSQCLASTHSRRTTSGRTILRSIKEGIFDFAFDMKRHSVEDDKQISRVCSKSYNGYREDEMLGYSLIRYATSNPEDVSIGSAMTSETYEDNVTYAQAGRDTSSYIENEGNSDTGVCEASGEAGRNGVTNMSVKENYYLNVWMSDLNVLISESNECFDLTSKASIMKKFNGLREDINRVITKEKHSDSFVDNANEILQDVITNSADLASRNISRERNARLYGAINLGDAWR